VTAISLEPRLPSGGDRDFCFDAIILPAGARRRHHGYASFDK